MSGKIKILIVEHDPNDIELIQYELKKGGINYISEILQTEDEYYNALKNFIPDIILSDYSLPSFSGLAAFEIKEKLSPLTPFIFVSGTIGEENSIELIKNGVTDFTLKDKLFTLPLKVKRALEEAKAKLQKIETDWKLRKSEAKFRQLMEALTEALIGANKEGKIVYANKEATILFGYSTEELLNSKIEMLMPGRFRERHEGYRTDFQANPVTRAMGKAGQPLYGRRKDGSEFATDISLKSIETEEGLVVMSVIRDITEKIKAEEYLKQSEAHLAEAQRLAKMGSWNFDLKTGQLTWSEELYNIFGTDKQTFRETHNSFLHLIDAEDREFALQTSRHTQQTGEPFTIEYRITTPKGEKRIIQEHGYGVKDEKGIVIRLFGTAQDITEGRLAEEALIESEFRFRTVADFTYDWEFWMNPDRQFVYISQSCERISGYRREEYMESGYLFLDIVYPDDIDAVKDKLAKAFMHETETGFDFRIIRKDGETQWLSLAFQPITDLNGLLLGIRGSIRNITDRKLAEEERLRLSSILEATSDFVGIAATDQRIIFLNTAGRIALGFGEMEDLSQKKIVDFSPDWANEIIAKEGIPAVLKTGKWIGETAFLTRGGVEIPVSQVIIAHKNDSGELQYISTIARDISVQKESERKLKKYAEELQASNTELERFAYIASHDLQEPLRMISSFLTLLEKRIADQLDETGKQYINFAVDGAGRMKTLIQDLLLYSRVGSKKEDFTAVDLNEVMQYSMRVLDEKIKETGTEITVKPLPVIVANKTLISQLFVNLVGNAIKYHGDKKPEIEIGYSEDPGTYSFYVKDNGIGIDPDYFDKIFVIFQRLHNKGEYSGTGIGLAICKKIVETHKGKIWVESEAYNGSTFYFTIPKQNI